MSASLDSYRDVLAELKQTAIAFLRQLKALSPQETPYAMLFEISDQSPGAWAIGATEESLARLAARYARKGYRARQGDDLEQLRIGLRWDAPGDDMDGWYWGDDSNDRRLNGMLLQRFTQMYAADESGYELVQRLCLSALGEIDREGWLGREREREQIVLGISNVDHDFSHFLGAISEVNPPSVIERLRSQLVQADQVWDDIARP
ncbi:MAG TPA: DUF4303 domain-containing protein [Pirellulaceae bacterium]|nr:DUF4303 domain-containing protein [Pirellulaceae bacterium]